MTPRLVLLAALPMWFLSACGEGGQQPSRPNGGSLSTTPGITCPSGARLPVTGLCNTADPYLFLAVDDRLDMLADRCVWRTEEAALSDSDALVFRAQDCTSGGWVRTIYSYVSGYLKHRMDGTPEDQADFALQIVPLGPNETPQEAALKTLSQAPEDQRTRCHIEPIDRRGFSGATFILTPTADLREELELWSDGEAFDACGPNGLSMTVEQFWEGRPGVALFHILGRELPQWDPSSFTFYHRDADGRWVKAS